MFRTRIAAAAATAALAAGAVVGIAPLASAGPMVTACVADLQSAQTANNAAIAADQANNPAGARIQNVAAATYLAAAIGDCQGQPTTVGVNVLTATATNATALVYNILGITSSALSSEQATASALTQALASAT